ncbi:Uncharacterised protein [Vibrio cholerae]|nr:Uncharacterised protein [Vibrio cholerae]
MRVSLIKWRALSVQPSLLLALVIPLSLQLLMS